MVSQEASNRPPATILKPKLLLVEGNDEKRLMSALASHEGMPEIEIRDFAGKSKLRDYLGALRRTPGFEQIVVSLGIVRDADNHPDRAFDSICNDLRVNKFPRPDRVMQMVDGKPRVGVLLLPGEGQSGTLEDLCLASVADDDAMPCVSAFMNCLSKQLGGQGYRDSSKARVHAFLATLQWQEVGYFETLQDLAQNRKVIAPRAATEATIRSFLASRNKPALRLGEAAEAGYWEFSHPAFNELKEFLRLLS